MLLYNDKLTFDYALYFYIAMWKVTNPNVMTKIQILCLNTELTIRGIKSPQNLKTHKKQYAFRCSIDCQSLPLQNPSNSMNTKWIRLSLTGIAFKNKFIWNGESFWHLHLKKFHLSVWEFAHCSVKSSAKFDSIHFDLMVFFNNCHLNDDKWFASKWCFIPFHSSTLTSVS